MRPGWRKRPFYNQQTVFITAKSHLEQSLLYTARFIEQEIPFLQTICKPITPQWIVTVPY